MSKGQSQPEIVATAFCILVHGSGWTILIPGFDCDSPESRRGLWGLSLAYLQVTPESCPLNGGATPKGPNKYGPRGALSPVVALRSHDSLDVGLTQG